MIMLIQGMKFNLKNIFKEICGPNKKYITYPRLFQAYVAYKTNSEEKSLEFKKFFSYVFTELLHVLIIYLFSLTITQLERLFQILKNFQQNT